MTISKWNIDRPESFSDKPLNSLFSWPGNDNDKNHVRLPTLKQSTVLLMYYPMQSAGRPKLCLPELVGDAIIFYISVYLDDIVNIIDC